MQTHTAHRRRPEEETASEDTRSGDPVVPQRVQQNQEAQGSLDPRNPQKGRKRLA